MGAERTWRNTIYDVMREKIQELSATGEGRFLAVGKKKKVRGGPNVRIVHPELGYNPR
jgi:hypothetical protein